MTPRHALQAAAKQFGFDGTDRSLRDLEKAFWSHVYGYPATAVATTGKLTADELAALPESFKEQMRRRPLNISRVPESYPPAIPATLAEGSHAE